ncbi:MAG TPA: tetratricopeptide repeat protein [Bryobacteraceae bacterium]|nr:tetratricopeptide repeat protein [Bryobacteraceae bacterium]
MWPAAVALLFWLQTVDYSAEGLKALEANKYEEAAQLFSKAVEADPNEYSAHFHLALSYSFLGKDAEAIPEYRKVLEIKPGLFEAELNLGIVLVRQKRAGEALPLLQSAAEKKPKDFRTVFYLAEATFAGGDFPKAEELYRSATEIDPKSPQAQLGLGRAMLRQDRLAEGAGHFRQAVSLHASFRDALLELAALYEKQKQPSEAIAIYQQFPDDAAARERLGELLIETGKPAEAVQHLEWAVAKSPTPANRLALAMAYIRGGQTEKAVPFLEQVVVAEPNNPELRMIYGRTLRDMKKYPDAAREFYRVAQAKPDSAEAWSELAGMLILLENYPQALAALDRVRALGAETAAHHFFRAIILDKGKLYEPALASYEKFLAMSDGKNPNEEFKARQRVRIIKKDLSRR